MMSWCGCNVFVVYLGGVVILKYSFLSHQPIVKLYGALSCTEFLSVSCLYTHSGTQVFYPENSQLLDIEDGMTIAHGTGYALLRPSDWIECANTLIGRLFRDPVDPMCVLKVEKFQLTENQSAALELVGINMMVKMLPSWTLPFSSDSSKWNDNTSADSSKVSLQSASTRIAESGTRFHQFEYRLSPALADRELSVHVAISFGTAGDDVLVGVMCFDAGADHREQTRLLRCLCSLDVSH